MKRFCILVCLLGGIVFHPNMAQERLKSAKIYSLGDSFSVPTYGLTVAVPLGWSGFYPQDSEIFKMANDSAQSIECMYFANKSTLSKVTSGWQKGFALAQGLSLELEGEMIQQDDITLSRVSLTNRKDVKGTVLARCGEYGVCVTALVYGPARLLEDYFTNLVPLLTAIEFSEPISKEKLDAFDWQKELTGKYLLAYERDVASKKQSQIWLYFDGTFKSKLSRTGLFKDSAGDYKGTKKGSYLIYNQDQGKPAKLVLLYNNLPEIELTLTRKDNQSLANDQVFYYSEM